MNYQDEAQRIINEESRSLWPSAPVRHVDCHVIVGDDASCCQLEVSLFGLHYVAVGDAKRHPKDNPRPEIGGMLATARALRTMADTLENEANRAVALNTENFENFVYVDGRDLPF